MTPSCVAAGGQRGRLIGITLSVPVSSAFASPKVQHLHGAVLSDLDIGWLQVAVNDTGLMSGLQSLGDLPGDRQGLIDWDRPPLAIRSARVGPSTSSNTSACVSSDFLDAVNGRDAGVVEASEHLRLTLEPG